MNLPPPPRFDRRKFEVQKTLTGEIFICRETLLPAYKDKADFNASNAKYFPGFALEKFWRCVWCFRYHAAGYFPRGAVNKKMRKEMSVAKALEKL